MEEDHSIREEEMEIICQMCNQEAHPAMKCSWVYSPCKAAKCDGIRITVESTTPRNPNKIFLTCPYGCKKSWEWLDKATDKWISSCPGGCLHCWDKHHLTKDCPWSGINCRHGDCDGKRYVRSSEESNTKKFLLCYACNDSQSLTEAKTEAEAVRGAQSPTLSIFLSESSPSTIISKIKIICQVCDEEAHSATECPWLYSPCKEADCNGRRIILIANTKRNEEKPYLTCQYGCDASWNWLDVAIGLCHWCFNCGDRKHLMKDCPWCRMKCRRHGCDGKRYVWESQETQTRGWKFLNCYACNDFQWFTEVKIDAETTTTSRKAETTIIQENVTLPIPEHCQTICQVCPQDNHLALQCPWVYSPCKEPDCNSILMIMVSQTSQALGRTYLKCQNECVDSKQWLDEAIAKGESIPKGCFKCYDDHSIENCRWRGMKCSHVYCNGKRYVLRTNKESKTNGWRFLQCNACNGDFQWLMVAKRQRQRQLGKLN